MPPIVAEQSEHNAKLNGTDLVADQIYLAGLACKKQHIERILDLHVSWLLNTKLKKLGS